MPIKPENKDKYPKNWKQISEYIRFERAQNKCEICGVVNYSWINKHTRELCLSDEFESIRVILTVMHLDHNPENNDYSNLKAACHRCHNRYDIPHRKQTRKATRNKNQYSLEL